MPLALKREHQALQNWKIPHFSYICVSLLPPGPGSAFSMRIRIRNRPPKIIAELDSKHCFNLVTDILQKSNLYPLVINFVSKGPPDTFQTIKRLNIVLLRRWKSLKIIFTKDFCQLVSHKCGFFSSLRFLSTGITGLAYGFLFHRRRIGLVYLSTLFIFSGLRIQICINFGSWIRIRTNVKIPNL